MRIAVIQLPAWPDRRTRTLQSALRAIDAAAEQDPAPDLIVLPAFADAAAAAAGRADLCEHVAGQTAAACAQRARTWGVFVAFGLAERGEGRPSLSGVLLDRDGDVRLVHRQVFFRPGADAAFSAGAGFSAATILLGRMAILTGDDLCRAEAWDAAAAAGAALVVGTACWIATGRDAATLEKIPETLAAEARRTGLACAVADVTAPEAAAGPPAAGLSRVIDARGEVIAAARPGGATTLRAALELPSPRAEQGA